MAVILQGKHQHTNPRIDGLELLEKNKSLLDFDLISLSNYRVITHGTFSNYFRQGDFAAADRKQILHAAGELLKISKTGLLAVRRAFFIPDFPDPPGPRFLGLPSAEAVLSAIKELYDFAIRHNYHRKNGALIEAFFYPFIDPPKISLPITLKTVMPKGGCALPTSGNGKTIKIMAVFGNNEGVQTLAGIDEYFVDIENLQITEKIIPQKQAAICTTDKAQDEKLALPLAWQFRQVLNDLEIIELALFLKQVMQDRQQPVRFEFSSDGNKLFVTEALKYELEQKNSTAVNFKGTVTVIENTADLNKIDTGSRSQILYISRAAVKNRNYDLLNAIAAFKSKLQILYPGTTATAHAMRVLVDKGHNAYVAGKQEFYDRDQVEISHDGKTVKINKIVFDREQQKIYTLGEASLADKELVGSKAFNLSRLSNLGYQIPDGYVISANVAGNSGFLKSSEFAAFLDKLPDNQLYSVRSSADVEDSAANAFAGQFDSFLNVGKKNIRQKIQAVWESAHTSHVKKLLQDMGIKQAKMAVIIQEMIKPKLAGVIFGGNIETKDSNQVVIEMVNDFAEKVVNGTGKIRKIIFDKLERTMVFDNRQKSVAASPEILFTLFQMYLKLEENFNNLQDVEWTIDKENELFLLQTRDLII